MRSKNMAEKKRYSRGITWSLSSLILFSLLLVSRLSNSAANAAHVPQDSWQEAGVIAVSPSFSSVAIDNSVTVEIWLQGVEDYYGLDFRMRFNPVLVQVPAGRVDPLWEVFDQDNHFVIKNTVDNAAGTIWYALTNVHPAVSFTGNGRVCTITFTGLSEGMTELEFYYAKGSTREGSGVYPVRAGGTLVVGTGGPVTVTPTPSFTSTMVTPSPTHTFTLSPTPTRFAAISPTATHTLTPEPTSTPTGIFILTATPTSTGDIGPIWTATSTAPFTYTATPSATPTISSLPTTICLRQGTDGYSGVSDTYLDLSNPNSNFGASNKLYVKTQDIASVLIRYDLAKLPAGAVILDARLSLYVNMVHPDGTPITLRALRLLKPWSEMQATWSFPLSGIPWGEAGCRRPDVDFAAPPIDEPVCLSGGQPISINLAYAVSFWASHPSQNHGITVKAFTCDDKSALYSFWSSQASWEAVRPQLCITYLVPTPTPSPTPSYTYTVTPTLTPVHSPTATHTATPTPSSTPTESPSASTGSVRGVVWHDINENFQVDPGEPYLPDAVINLYLHDHLVRTHITGLDGYYRFDNLAPGVYLLIELDPPGYSSTTSNTRVFTLEAGQTVIVNFGDRLMRTATPTLPGFPTFTPTVTATATTEIGIIWTPTSTPPATRIRPNTLLPLISRN